MQCEKRARTSCGGTSYVLVRKSTRAYASTQGKMKNIPVKNDVNQYVYYVM